MRFINHIWNTATVIQCPSVVSNYPVEDGDDSPAHRRAEIKDNTEREARGTQSNDGASGGRAVEKAAVRDNLTKNNV